MALGFETFWSWNRDSGYQSTVTCIVDTGSDVNVFVYHRVLATGEVCLEQNKYCDLLDTSS